MAYERTGRNDPCPCGSGKKYKRCCLPEDERRSAMQRAPALAKEPSDSLPPATLDPRRIAELLREYAATAPKEKRDELERLLNQVGPLLDCVERQSEIEAASKALEAHRAEFEKLADDYQAYAQRSKALFAEEPFAPLRFTADDVRRAFAHVGQPSYMATDDQFVKIVRAAILHLADKDRRSQLAMNLLLRLPEYVAAGRPLDACLIEECAYRTADLPDESNPFLFQMFSYGYDAWAAEQRALEVAVLREIGLDLPQLESMNLDEIDAWVAQQQADPAQWAKLEAVLKAHPAQQALAVANYEEMQRNSAKLLEREDAAGLLLSKDELSPWLPRLFEALEKVLPQLREPDSSVPNPAEARIFVEAIQPVLREMTAGIFTAERRRQLVAQLKTYRNNLFAAGDKRAAGYAQAAMSYVEQEDEPDKNSFLNLLCFASIRALKE